MYPFALPHYAQTWVICSVVLFTVALALTGWLALRAVTAADVQRVARQYLTPDRAHVVVVGDLSKVKEPIEKLGLGTSTTLEVSKLAK